CLSVHVRRPRRPPLFPYTTLFRSRCARHTWASDAAVDTRRMPLDAQPMGHPSRNRLAPTPRQAAIKTGVQTYWQRMSTTLAGSGLLAPRSVWRAAFSRLRSFAARKQAPPPREQAPDRVVYGLAQPLLGLRMLVSDSEILREALIPAAWLGAFCAVAAAVSHDGSGWWDWVKSFYKTFAVLAPVPSIIFAKHYARLAAMVRWRLGFGPCGPREYSIAVSLKRAIQQA